MPFVIYQEMATTECTSCSGTETTTLQKRSQKAPLWSFQPNRQDIILKLDNLATTASNDGQNPDIVQNCAICRHSAGTNIRRNLAEERGRCYVIRNDMERY
jgi:hypothetical protein